MVSFYLFIHYKYDWVTHFPKNVALSDRLVFHAEWFQEEACLNRSFYFYYFPGDNAVEIVSLSRIVMFAFLFFVQNGVIVYRFHSKQV